MHLKSKEAPSRSALRPDSFSLASSGLIFPEPESPQLFGEKEPNDCLKDEGEGADTHHRHGTVCLHNVVIVTVGKNVPRIPSTHISNWNVAFSNTKF